MWSGGGDEVDHSSVLASQASPDVSRSCSRRRKLTISCMMKEAMPIAIRTAPKAAMMNQICSDGSSNWLTRRVTPIRPST
ncbi:hypothetical protein D9M72_552160 [compost metagenome]